jgi:hypothetical protein
VKFVGRSVPCFAEKLVSQRQTRWIVLVELHDQYMNSSHIHGQASSYALICSNIHLEVSTISSTDTYETKPLLI